jgi:uncharacterized protein YecT (DUF1311 family)
MTTFRFSLFLAFAFAPLIALHADPVRDEKALTASCDNIDPFAERHCVSKRIAAKERLLEATYKRAMQSVRKNFARYGQWDRRSDPVYLTRSQSAWKQYVDNDCKVQAAFGGGSNPSISDRELECYEDALDKRLKVLRQLADETLNVG